MIIENGVYKVHDITLYVYDDSVRIETFNIPLSKSNTKVSFLNLFLNLGKSVYLNFTCADWLCDKYAKSDFDFLKPYSSYLTFEIISHSTGAEIFVSANKKSCE